MITNQLDVAIRSAKAISEESFRAVFVWTIGPCKYELDFAIPHSYHKGFLCYVTGEEVFWQLPN